MNVKELKNYPAAEADYTKAIKFNPKCAEAYNNRGLIRQLLKNYLAAKADRTQAIDIDPNYAEAYLSRGVLYILKNY